MTTRAPAPALTPLNRAATLLRRLGVVELPELPGRGQPRVEDVLGALLGARALPSVALVDALHAATPGQRRGAMEGGVQALRLSLGDAPSVPQLRDFARTQVWDTGAAFHARLAAWYGLDAVDAEHCALRHDPNVLPGTWGTAALDLDWVDTEKPRHTRACASGLLGTAAQGACAICHLRVGDAEALLRVAAEDRTRRADRPLPLRGVDLAPTGAELVRAMQAALETLAASATPLSEEERGDLTTLVTLLLEEGAPPAEIASGLIERGVPQREVRALAVGTLIARSGEADVLAQVQEGLGLLPTDVLRVLDVWGGGDGTLARAPIPEETDVLGQLHAPTNHRLGQLLRRALGRAEPAPPQRPKTRREPHVRLPHLSRPQRRAVGTALERSLAALAGQGEEGRTLAWEALHRHREAWARVLRRLHVHERPRDWPHLCALAGLRSAGGDASALGPLRPEVGNLARAVAQETPGGPHRARTLMGGVELALARGDLAGAVALLDTRPGLLGRSLDRLLRLEAAHDPAAPLTLAGLERAAPRLSAVMVAGLHAHLGRRHTPDPARHFRSRGKAAVRGLGDTRPTLPPGVIGRAQTLLEAELLRRGAQAPELGTLEIDPELLGVRLAASARAASGGLEGLAPGSVLPLTPKGTAATRTARLFLHWAEKAGAGSIDLDLSVMGYSERGAEVAVCSFHQLRAPGMVHSGDLRSAPLPAGATEYVDLDLGALRGAGITHLLASVHSYTSIPFSQMERASCGLMVRTDTGEGAREMDLGTVRLRFDLRGEQTSCLLLALDLRQIGREQVTFLEIGSDERGGHRTLTHDGQVELALQMAGAAQGLPLPLLLAAHAARAGRVLCGETQWQRRAGEDRTAFAERVQFGLLDLQAGQARAGDAPGAAPTGPTLLVAAQPDRALNAGDRVICLQAGVSQPAGVEVQGLRGLLGEL